MTPYLTTVLTLLTTHPGALVLMTLRVLVYLHITVPALYLFYRIGGGQWDGIAWTWRVLLAVHELRRARAVRRIGWAVGVVVLIVVVEVV